MPGEVGRPGARGAGFYVAVAILIVLLLGKTLHLPLAFVLVTSDSMSPSLEAGDLVVGVSPRLAGYRVGDVVVCCRDTLRTACIVHKLVSVNGRTLVTRGSANPAPDPVIPKSMLSYVVVARIPFYLWVPAALAVAVILIVYSFKRLIPGAAPSIPGLTLATLLSLFLVFNAAVVGLSYVDNSQPYSSPPLIRLLSVSLDPRSRVESILLNTTQHRVLNASCTLDGGVKPEGLTVSTRGELARITLVIPQAYFLRLWNQTSASLRGNLPGPPALVEQFVRVRCRVVTDKAVLIGSYTAGFTWREPSLIREGDRILVANDNPVPLRVSFYIFSQGSMGGVTIYHNTTVLKPYSRLSIDVGSIAGRPGTYTVRVYYEFLGGARGQAVALTLNRTAGAGGRGR